MEAIDPEWPWLLLTTMESSQSWWLPISRTRAAILQSQISGLHHHSYWDQLKELKLHSLERRRERYIPICIWCILEGSAPNISDSHGITFKWHPRRGTVCIVPPISSSAPAQVHICLGFGPLQSRELESLTPCLGFLRNLTAGTVDAFKRRIDTFLQNVPDQPLIPGYTAYRSVDSNSLLSWAAHQAWHRPECTVVPMFQQSFRVDQPGSS